MANTYLFTAGFNSRATTFAGAATNAKGVLNASVQAGKIPQIDNLNAFVDATQCNISIGYTVFNTANTGTIGTLIYDLIVNSNATYATAQAAQSTAINSIVTAQGNLPNIVRNISLWDSINSVYVFITLVLYPTP